MKHTKGNWKVDIKATSCNYSNVTSKMGYRIVSIGDKEDWDIAAVWKDLGKESLPNAKIIAAAPDLLEACMNIENDDNHIPLPIWNMIQEAIKKATE